jgi:hypothetical protein
VRGKEGKRKIMGLEWSDWGKDEQGETEIGSSAGRRYINPDWGAETATEK